MKILVTGGAGFIGSHIVDSLVEEGVKVVVYDNFSFGTMANLEKSKKKIKIVRGEILDYQALKEAMQGVDFVSHQAAQLEIFRASFDPLYDLKVNTLGTLNVLKAAKENKVKKIINASSACVYGQPLYIPQDENHPTNPNWAYGVSKLAAEKYCQIFMQESGIPVVSLRYGIVYGPREWYRRVLTIFLKRVLERKDLVIFGDGKEYRDFVYVDDVVRFHNLCLFSNKANGQILNVGTGKATSIGELAGLVIKELSSPKKLKIKYEKVKEGEESKLVKGKRRNPQDLKGMCLDNKKAYELIRWKPEVPLEEGIRREFAWLKLNSHRWRVINYSK